MSSDERGCLVIMSVFLQITIQIVPYERSSLPLHANSDIVSQAATLSNIPMTRSELNDVDFVGCYLHTYSMFFSSKDVFLFAFS